LGLSRRVVQANCRFKNPGIEKKHKLKLKLLFVCEPPSCLHVGKSGDISNLLLSEKQLEAKNSTKLIVLAILLSVRTNCRISILI
jgi:hypothetical protein